MATPTGHKQTHYEREKGQAKERYRLKVNASHDRIDAAGNRYTVYKDDTFHPTENELAAFGDKFEMVSSKPTATFDDDVQDPKTIPAPKTETKPPAIHTPANPTGGDQEAFPPMTTGGPSPLGSVNESDSKVGKDGNSNESGKAKGPEASDFTTTGVHDAWVEAGKPKMTVPRTGNKETQWSKKDLEAQIEKSSK